MPFFSPPVQTVWRWVYLQGGGFFTAECVKCVLLPGDPAQSWSVQDWTLTFRPDHSSMEDKKEIKGHAQERGL